MIRSYLRYLGPATPQDVAGFLDAAVADIKSHWPEDAVEVSVHGKKAWSLSAPAETSVDPGLLRLLGPFDLLLQGRDRNVIVPDKTRHRALWPTLGRPGAVLSGAEIVGVWRPKASGKKFTVRLDAWMPLGSAVMALIEEQATRPCWPVW